MSYPHSESGPGSNPATSARPISVRRDVAPRRYRHPMGRIGNHGRRVEILIGQLCGAVERHARTGGSIEDAVAELHALTIDPHLLGHAWAHEDPARGMSNPWLERINEILRAAGADEQPPWWGQQKTPPTP